MKTKIKRHSRSVISVLLSVCMLISCMTVGLIATDAAKVTDTVGDTGWRIKGDWDKNGSTWVDHSIAGDGYTVNLSANKVYNFVLLDESSNEYSANTTISGSTEYNFAKQNGSVKLQTGSTGGNYTFKYINHDTGSVRVDITFPAAVPEDETNATWTIAGDNTALFTELWADNKVENDLAQVGTTDMFKKQWSNVLLNKGTIKYKVVKNHSWDAGSYPADNKVKEVPATGYYDVEATFDRSNHTPDMTLTGPAKYKFSIADNASDDVTITAEVGSTTIGEGENIAEVLPGAKISVTATTASGKRCTSITVQYTDVADDNQLKTVTYPVSSSTCTFDMPLGEATITGGTAEDYKAETKTVYFYNKVTQYPKVGIYVYYKDSSGNISEEVYKVGTLMTKYDNSDIWYFDNVPADAYIAFNGDGYSTGELQPLNTHPTQPKYIPGKNRTDPRTGGTWGEYLERDNIYHVSKGSTLTGDSNTNIFTAINATFYDYMVDNEVTGGWLKGISETSDYKCEGDSNDPYRAYLNSALSDYADNTADTYFPANNITYPLYWGNNKTDNTSGLHNFVLKVNNSTGLGTNKANDALTGLSGTTLAGGTIHHYKNGVDNQDGPIMAFFDEDFLSGENTKGKALATILHSNAFPVRQEEIKVIYFDNGTANKTIPSGETIYAHIWKSDNTSLDVRGQKNGNIYSFEVPNDYVNVIFYHSASGGVSETNKYTGDLVINFSKPQYNGSSWVTPSFSKTKHTYYEYDSTGGKDNAFITDINPSSKEALLNYYPGENNAVHSQSSGSPKGFFPFDYNNMWGGTFNPDKVYVKVHSGWKGANARTAAYFFKSDNSVVAKWVDMTQVGETDVFECLIPTDESYNMVGFARINPATTPNSQYDFEADPQQVWNKIDRLTLPTTNKVLYTIPDNTYDSTEKNENWSNGGINVPYTPASENSYSDSGKLAHDQGFGMKLEIPFTLNAKGLNDDGTAQTFDFSGDDDLWVFIDDKLVLDLGGAHGRTTGSINFNTMTATANNSQAVASGVTRNGSFSSVIDTAAQDFNPDKIHTMTIYYMERGMFDSNLKFGFSFHAIPNQFQAEKKVRGSEVNSGFYYTNGQSSTASNMSQTYIDKGTRQITYFEDSYQNDVFTIHQSYTTTNKTTTGEIKYALGNEVYTPEISDKTITYDLKNNNDDDRIAIFNGQFLKNDTFTVRETFDSDATRFNYVPRAIIRDESKAKNQMNFTPVDADPGQGEVSGNNESGYQFIFHPKDNIAEGGMEDIRIRARFENEIKTHSLTIKKTVENPIANNNEDFTIEVMFQFENEGYKAYPLFIENAGGQQLDGTGRFTLKAGQSVTFLGIPERADVRVREIYNSNSAYAFKEVDVNSEDGSTLETTASVEGNDEGVTFRMGSANATAEVINTSGEPVYISHSKLSTSPGGGKFYVTANVKADGTAQAAVEKAYSTTTGVITVDKFDGGESIITKGSNKYLEIILETQPNSGYSFKKFYDGITESVRELQAIGVNPTYTATIENDQLKATVLIKIGDLFDSKGKQLFTELPFYSELEQLYSVEVTKDIDNDNTLADLENLHTNFPVRILISKDDGTTYTDLNSNDVTVTDKDSTTTPVTKHEYRDVSTDNWFSVYNVRQKDVLTIPNLKADWKVKVEEVKADEIIDDANNGNRAAFRSDFKDALANYTFTSAAAKIKNAESNTATNAAGTQSVDFTVPESNDMLVTITNSAILYTVEVTKEFLDNFPDDGSTFELTATYNPTGSDTSGNYHAVTNGTVTPAIPNGKIGDTDGVYTVKKNSKLTFTNIPKGTFFKVTETSFGNSPVTGSARFELDHMQLGNERLGNGHYFVVTGDDTDKTISLSVVNKVKKSWIDITKAVTPTETPSDSTQHQVKISVDYNGDNQPLSSIDYRTTKDLSASATTVNADTAIGIQRGGSIWLYYPIGSTISVEELQGVNDYEIYSISASNTKGDPVYTSTSGGSKNNKVTFKTNDNGDATVTITNSLIPDIKYEITYNFPSRGYLIGSNPGAAKYGDLSYKVEGTGKPSAILENDKIMKSIVEKKVPYEKNFMQNMTWHFDNISYSEPTVENGTTVYRCSVSATTGSLPTVRVEFYFPYDTKEYDVNNAYHDDNENSHWNTDKVGTIYGPDDTKELTYGDYQSQEYAGLLYQSNPTVYAWRERTVKDDKGQDVTQKYQEKFSTYAAESVEGHKFLYWSICSLNRNNPGTPGNPNYTEVARCYEATFNYTIFDNYKVYAIYSNPDASSDQSSETPDNSTDKLTTINFLDYSRNHWNNSAHGGYPQLSEGDAVWTDFDVSFKNGKELISAGSSEVGVLVERVQDSLDASYDLDPSAANYSTNYQHYVDKYNKNSGDNVEDQYIKAKWEEAAKTYILGTTLKQNSRTENEDRVKTVLNSSLTNKNRMEFGFAMFVNSGSQTGSQSAKIVDAKKNGLYRAYSYMRIQTGKDENNNPKYEIVLCDTPVYFSVKNEASKITNS